MSAARLLAHLRALGVTLAPEGDVLGYDAPEGIMTPERLDVLRRHKAEIMGLLDAEARCEAPTVLVWVEQPAPLIEAEERTGATRSPQPGDVRPEPWVARCLIRGCVEPTGTGDLAYCLEHRRQADEGTLWTAEDRADDEYGPASVDVGSEVTLGAPLDGLFAWLRERDAVLIVERGRLGYFGPPLRPDDPILAAIDFHRALLIELLTFAPGGRCTAESCYRLRRPEGGTTTCPDHQQVAGPGPLQATP